jgi:hypothetical protein
MTDTFKQPATIEANGSAFDVVNPSGGEAGARERFLGGSLPLR